jgi:signal transduction histidine kinase
MEGIGQLAAGVAHEINTPVQFIGDSTRFLGDVLGDLMGLLEEYQQLRSECAGDPRFATRCQELLELEDDVDLELMRAEAPAAVTRTIGGVERVSRIVAALKQFAHPSAGTVSPIDLNQIIETTLVVARNEYRYVADVTTELGDIRPVIGDAGDLSQVVLNLVVNAAHAIADRGDGQQGAIRIRTSESDQGVELSISDTGTGIPDAIIERVFDPFFTTKEVGRGTGQGLAIVRSIVVERHHGSVDIATEPGVGTTFTIRFPSSGRR